MADMNTTGVGPTQAGLEGAARGLTSNLFDYLPAGMGMAVGKLQGKDYSFDELLKAVRARHNAVALENPISDTVGNIAGSIGQAAATGGTSIPRQIGTQALSGAVNTYAGSPDATAADAAQGAATQGGIAGAFGGLVKGVNSLTGASALHTLADKIEDMVYQGTPDAKMALENMVGASAKEVRARGSSIWQAAQALADNLRSTARTMGPGDKISQLQALAPEMADAMPAGNATPNLIPNAARGAAYAGLGAAGGTGLNEAYGEPVDPATAATVGAVLASKGSINKMGPDLATRMALSPGWQQLIGRVPAMGAAAAGSQVNQPPIVNIDHYAQPIPGMADGGRVEPRVGTYGPVRTGGSGGLSPQAVQAAIAASSPAAAASAAEMARQAALKKNGIGLLKANPVTNPQGVTDQQLSDAEALALQPDPPASAASGAGMADGGLIQSEMTSGSGQQQSNDMVNGVMNPWSWAYHGFPSTNVANDRKIYQMIKGIQAPTQAKAASAPASAASSILPKQYPPQTQGMIAPHDYLPDDVYKRSQQYVDPAASSASAMKKGGKVKGKGGPRSDNQIRRLSPGEFVVNAKSSKKIGYDMLNKLNKV